MFVADEKFTMKLRLMKLYARRNLTKEQKNFNYRLSRADNIIINININNIIIIIKENSFRILTSRFIINENPTILIREK